MKICLMGSKSYPPTIGGIEMHIFELSHGLALRGHEVNVIAGRYTNDKRYEKLGGINVYRVPFIESRFTTKITMISNAILIARKIKADIYHTHGGIFGFFHSLLLNNQFIHTAHGHGYHPGEYPFPFEYFAKILDTTSFKNANQVIAVDSETAKEVAKYNKHVHIIENGVNIEKFDKQMPIPKEYKSHIKIIYVGRLIYRKGVHLLIEAFSKLPKKIKENASLFIIGEGPMKLDLMSKIKKQENINFLGYVEDVVPYLVHSDIFVLPSLYEGMPFTILEAMASKCACISTKIGDLPTRFTNNRDLIFVKPNNSDALAKALSMLIINSELRKKISHNGYEIVKNEYSWDKIIPRTEEIYRTFLSIQ